MTTLVSRNVSMGLCYHVCHSRSPNLAGGVSWEITATLWHTSLYTFTRIWPYEQLCRFSALASRQIRRSGARVVGVKSPLHSRPGCERNRLLTTAIRTATRKESVRPLWLFPKRNVLWTIP